MLFWQKYNLGKRTIVAEDDDPVFFDSFTKNIVHGPCGEYNLISLYIRNGVYLFKKCPQLYITNTHARIDIHYIIEYMDDLVWINEVLTVVQYMYQAAYRDIDLKC